MRQFLASTFAAVALALCVGAPAHAASIDGSTAPKLSNMSVEQFLDYHTKLSRDLNSKKYDYVNRNNRDRIAKQQASIRELLSGHQSMSELNEVDRLAVFNAHESVVAIMNDASLDKVTCRRQHKMGSHRPETICTTAREQRLKSDESRDQFVRPKTCASGASCGY